MIPDLADEPEIKAGLLKALQIYLDETPLSHVVGESGLLSAHVDVHFERGRAAWVKGGVGFSRRITLGGS